MKTISALLIMLFFTTVSANAYEISGVAVDSNSGSPLVGIELGLELPDTYIFATTGSDGSFTFTDLSNGSFLLYYFQSNLINGAWYLHQEYGQVDVNNGDVSGITFELDPHFPNYGISGTIYDASTGETITNLNYSFQFNWDDSMNYALIIPNSDGTYSISNLPDWSYTIEWSGNNDYEGFVLSVSIEQNGPNTVVTDIYLQPKSGPFISGILMDFDTQEPINMAGRTIRLSDLPSSHFTETNENGEFRINGLEPGTYYELEVTTEDTAFINGEGSIVNNLIVPENGLTDVIIYQYKFESAHEVVASTNEFTAGETLTIDFSILYDDPVYSEIWGVMLKLPEGVTAVSTPAFQSVYSGETIFTRNYECSSSSRLVWEGWHTTFIGGPEGNLALLGDEAASGVSLHFDESLADESVEIEYEIYYTYTCVQNYFSYGSVVLNENSEVLAGVAESSSDNVNIKMGPNPATNEVNLSSSSLIKQIIISNLSGKTLMNSNFNTERASINISEFPAGLYVVQIVTESGVNTEKLIVR